MKKIRLSIYIITFFLITFFVNMMDINAASKYQSYAGVVSPIEGANVRQGAASTSTYIMTLTKDTSVTYTENDIYDSTDGENDTCPSKKWIYLSTHKGYTCQDKIQVTKEETIYDYSKMAELTEEEFDEYLTYQSFPETYKALLRDLHEKHPSWAFTSVLTGRDWTSTLNEESQIGYSTIEVTKSKEAAGWEGYLNTDAYYNWSTDWFTAYDGWFFLANKQTVSYYLDPRNFLNEFNIFMYEGLYYNELFQSTNQVTSILKTDKYTTWLFEAGKEHNISPIFLAARIRQEGVLGNRVTSGTIGVTCNEYNKYSASGTIVYNAPIYNFYNIGATSSPTNSDLNGLCYAASKGWTTEEIAIKQGARWISLNYVGNGKYTLYFQKYNTSTATSDLSYQYMTNIEAPYSESWTAYNTYLASNALEIPYIFYIPVYNNMPNEIATKPPLGNPNNWLSSLKVNGSSVTLFAGNKTDYTLIVPSTTKSVVVEGTTITSMASIVINDSPSKLKTLSKEIALTEGDNVITLIVTAGNGDKKTYTISITKEEVTGDELAIEEILDNLALRVSDDYISGITFGTSADSLVASILESNPYATIQITNNNDEAKTGSLGTGDKITITSNQITKTYNVVVYGDINGDSEITINDILKIQKHLWGDSTLIGTYEKAADIDKDGLVKINDILKIQKHLWGDSNISQ